MANPNKPKPILDILLRNQDKLVDFLSRFHTDRSEDEQFNDEKAFLIKQIKELKSSSGSATAGASSSSNSHTSTTMFVGSYGSSKTAATGGATVVVADSSDETASNSITSGGASSTTSTGGGAANRNASHTAPGASNITNSSVNSNVNVKTFSTSYRGIDNVSDKPVLFD